MQTVKKTYSEINVFTQVASQLLKKKKEGELVLPEGSKLRYAIQRVLPKCVEHLTDYNEANEDLQVEHASVDTEGNMLKEVNSTEYRYTPAKKVEYNKKVRELFRKKQVDAPQYIAQEIPKWLEEDTKMIFDGFVLNYVEEPQLEVVNG